MKNNLSYLTPWQAGFVTYRNETVHNQIRAEERWRMPSESYSLEKTNQPSRNRAGNPAFLPISCIPAFSRESPTFLALF